MNAIALDDGPLHTPAHLPLYTSGRFTGLQDSIEHDAHLTICAYGKAESDVERESAERRYLELQETYPDAVARVLKARGVAEPAETGQRKPRRFLNTSDFTAQTASGPGYVVKGLLSRHSHALMYGPPGAGKSFLALDLAYAVAQGREWMGHKVNGGIVVYIPFEGGGGMGKRVRALVAKYGHAPDFRVIENPDYNLQELSGRQALGQDLAAALGDEKPALIAFDTLARVLRGDENSAKDMGGLNSAIAALIEATGCCALLVHHSGKDASRGARGSSALLGALDTEIQIDDNQIRATKQRDFELGAPIGFKLAPAIVGTDEDGDQIYSCTIEPAAASAGAKWKPTGQVLDAWHALCNLAPNNEAVTKREWAEAFTKAAWPTDPPEAKSARVMFQRTVKALLRAGWVTETPDGWQRPLTGGSDD
jgi:hypothetical protein